MCLCFRTSPWTYLWEKWGRIPSSGSHDKIRTKGYALIAAQERGAGLTVCVKCQGIVVLAFSSSDESAWDWDFLEEDTVSCLVAGQIGGWMWLFTHQASTWNIIQCTTPNSQTFLTHLLLLSKTHTNRGSTNQNGQKEYPPIITKLIGLVDIGLIRMNSKFEREIMIKRSLVSFMSTIFWFVSENYLSGRTGELGQHFDNSNHS